MESITTTVYLLASKKRKVTDASTILSNTTEDSSSQVTKEWVRFGKGLVLTLADKEHILAGEKLNDRHIDLAQNMLKQQFSELWSNLISLLCGLIW